MKKLFTVTCSLFAVAAIAALEAVDIADGESVRMLAPGKVVAVRAASSVAAGTVAVKAAAEVPVFTNGVVTTYATNVAWRLVWTNGTTLATNDYPRPYQYARPATTAFYGPVTNVTATSRAAALVKQILHPTNTLSSITCSGGIGSDAPSGKWVLPGDVLLWDGTAKGRVTVILER